MSRRTAKNAQSEVQEHDLSTEGETPTETDAARPEAPEGEGAPKAGRSKYAGQRIFATAETNPRREGTWGWRSMNIILANPGITYEDFIAAGGRRQDLAWDADREHVRFED